MDETVRFVRTPCNYGGERIWLECPGCGRKRTALFFSPNYPQFECRVCHDLTYASQQRGHSKWRTLRANEFRIERLQVRLRRVRNADRRVLLESRLVRLKEYNEYVNYWGLCKVFGLVMDPHDKQQMKHLLSMIEP